MTIDWLAFALVVGVTLVSACGVVAIFSLALRLGDGDEPWRRPAAVALYVVCAAIALFGIYLIVPGFH